MEGNANADLEFASKFDTGLKLRSKQPQITDQYMYLSFNMSLQCIPLGDLLDEPCLESSSGSRFRFGTSMKRAFQNSFCWKTILTPTEVSTNLRGPCWATDLSQRSWQTLCHVLSNDTAPAGEAWPAHGLECSSEPSLSRRPERPSSHISCSVGSAVGRGRGSHPSPRAGGLWCGHCSSRSLSRLSASSRWLRFRQSEKQSA